MKETWDRLKNQHPQLAGLGCRVIGFDATQSTIESIIDATLRNPLGGSSGQFASFREEGGPTYLLSRCIYGAHWMLLEDGMSRFSPVRTVT